MDPRRGFPGGRPRAEADARRAPARRFDNTADAAKQALYPARAPAWSALGITFAGRIVAEARQAQDLIFTHRDRSLLEISKLSRFRPATFARLVRLNYLAPDIIAAILDGTQPASLTRKGLLRFDLPTDWRLQRILLGFEEKPDCPSLPMPCRFQGKRSPSLRTRLARFASAHSRILSCETVRPSSKSFKPLIVSRWRRSRSCSLPATSHETSVSCRVAFGSRHASGRTGQGPARSPSLIAFRSFQTRFMDADHSTSRLLTNRQYFLRSGWNERPGVVAMFVITPRGEGSFPNEDRRDRGAGEPGPQAMACGARNPAPRCIPCP